MKLTTITLLQSLTLPALSSPNLNIGFSPSLVAQQATRLSAHSWEYGTLAEALLEFHNSTLSVFSPTAFPHSKLPSIPSFSSISSLLYAKPKISLNTSTLIPADGAAGDPCSLGVSALLLGQTLPSYLSAASRQAQHLLRDVPRWPNGAISHREAYPELWSDSIYMAPPFLAYYAVATSNVSLLRFTVDQIGLYRQVLLPPNTPKGTVGKGAWTHIAGPPIPDPGLWSTGSGWVVMGMARVLATVMHWDPTACDDDLKGRLMGWMGEVLDGAMSGGMTRDPKSGGLLRDYLNDTAYMGETSGTAGITSAVYRLAVLQEEEEEKGKGNCSRRVGAKPVSPAMLAWADENRRAIAKHVNGSGIAAPSVDPFDSKAYIDGSPEGESFLVILYSAWRDCVRAKICKNS